MIRSMTGFGQAETSSGGWRCTAELRSVNGRYLDVRLRLPSGLTQLEEPLRKQIKAVCERGKIDGTINLSAEEGGRPTLAINRPLLEGYRAVLDEIAEVLGQPVRVTLSDLLANRELIQQQSWEQQAEQVQALVHETLQAALAGLLTMRETEGNALKATLLEHAANLERMVDEAKPLTADVPAQYARRLRENLARLSDGPMPAEDRILQEISLFADRCDVTEEFARLYTHLEHLRQLLEQGGPVGRKFEFLLQELNRETNTLGTKSSEAQVSALIVEMKSEIEKLREQVQNIE
ncbi:MAG TPA: YicC/YloC family endoribonuclease [bacterium]|nr:YicC/YloC family endoribonuclease [bacterium]